MLARKESFLTVLDHPELPLYNSFSELEKGSAGKGVRPLLCEAPEGRVPRKRGLTPFPAHDSGLNPRIWQWNFFGMTAVEPVAASSV